MSLFTSGPMRFWISEKPVAWSRPRFNSRSKAVFNSEALRKYECTLRSLFKKSLNLGLTEPLSGDLKVTLRFYLNPPKRKVRERPSVKPDLDNLTKAVKDSGNGILWKDDSQIVQIEAEKLYDWETRKVGIELIVEEIKE